MAIVSNCFRGVSLFPHNCAVKLLGDSIDPGPGLRARSGLRGFTSVVDPQPALRFYLVAEHTGCQQGAHMLRNTRTTNTYGWYRFLAWNMVSHFSPPCNNSLPLTSVAVAVSRGASCLSLSPISCSSAPAGKNHHSSRRRWHSAAETTTGLSGRRLVLCFPVVLSELVRAAASA